MEFVGHIILSGELECITGFATRSDHPSYRLAGVDLPILRNPLTGLPYIPGSLFKGKLRYLLEHCYADQIQPSEEGICRCGKRTCPVCPLFGVEHRGNERGDAQHPLKPIELGCRPARLRFLDLLPTTETQRRWEQQRKDWGGFVEIKAENTVDRVNLTANPRLLERVPPGARFRYEIQMGLYRFSDTEDQLQDLDRLPVLKTAFRLLNDDTLGGHGSRGYGQVHLHSWQARFISRPDYLREGRRLVIGGAGTVLTAGRYKEDIQAYLQEDNCKAQPQVLLSSSSTPQDAQGTSPVTHIVTFRPYHTLVSEPLHSDTLFGALAWALRVVHGKEGPKLVEKLIRETDIVFSSVFPFVETDQTRTLFFPRPLVTPLPLRENDPDYKTFAKWTLASLDVFNRLISGEVTEEHIREHFCSRSSAKIENAEADKAYVCLDKRFLLTQKEYEHKKEVWKHRGLFADTDLTRTSIDRRTSGAAEGRLFFSQELLTTEQCSGYFFLMRATQAKWQEWQAPLGAALAFLADRGLGGDLSAGRGKLKDVKMEPFTGFQEPALPQRSVILSLYYPAAKTLADLQHCWYRLLPRKGKVDITYLPQANPFKARIQMFAEGSTFPLPVSDLKGQNPVVQHVTAPDNFSVIQWGQPFAVGMHSP